MPRKFHLKLLDDAPLLIWRANASGECDWFNATWLAFTGRSMDQELGSGWAAGVYPDDLNACLASYNAAVETRQPFELVYRLRRHDGVYRWILDHGVPYYTIEGEFGGFIGYCFDITERKLAEQDLENSHAQLQALLGKLQRAQEVERIRVARDIHDNLGQSLTGLKLELQWLENKLSNPENPPTLNSLLERVVSAAELADSTIEMVQRIALELRPSVLDELGLSSALMQEARQFQERSGVTCEVAVQDHDTQVMPETATELFYICREALTNVSRHAQATHVGIELRNEAGNTVLIVRDDGVGINDKDFNAPHALGLLGMRERALYCGGTVTIQHEQPRGTRITARMPFLTA